MDLQEITAAVDAGKTVNWVSPVYSVIKDSHGQYLLAYLHGTPHAAYVGLTHADGVTLNGDAGKFYLAENGPPPAEKSPTDVPRITLDDLSDNPALLDLVNAAWRVVDEAGDWTARRVLWKALLRSPTRAQIQEHQARAVAPLPTSLYPPGCAPAPAVAAAREAA